VRNPDQLDLELVTRSIRPPRLSSASVRNTAVPLAGHAEPEQLSQFSRHLMEGARGLRLWQASTR